MRRIGPFFVIGERNNPKNSPKRRRKDAQLKTWMTAQFVEKTFHEND